MRPDAIIDKSQCPDPISRTVTGPPVKPGDIVGAGRDVGVAISYNYADQTWLIRAQCDAIRIGQERIDYVSWRS